MPDSPYSSRHPSDPCSFLHLHIHAPYCTCEVNKVSLVCFESLVQNTVCSSNLFPAFSFLRLQRAERFSSLTLSHMPKLFLTSNFQLLVRVIVYRHCEASMPAQSQPFFLNCQQHQLVPHVLWVCTVAAVAKCFKCGQNANWPIDKFLGVSWGEKV